MNNRHTWKAKNDNYYQFRGRGRGRGRERRSDRETASTSQFRSRGRGTGTHYRPSYRPRTTRDTTKYKHNRQYPKRDIISKIVYPISYIIEAKENFDDMDLKQSISNEFGIQNNQISIVTQHYKEYYYPINFTVQLDGNNDIQPLKQAIKRTFKPICHLNDYDINININNINCKIRIKFKSRQQQQKASSWKFSWPQHNDNFVGLSLMKMHATERERNCIKIGLTSHAQQQQAKQYLKQNGVQIQNANGFEILQQRTVELKCTYEAYFNINARSLNINQDVIYQEIITFCKQYENLSQCKSQILLAENKCHIFFASLSARQKFLQRGIINIKSYSFEIYKGIISEVYADYDYDDNKQNDVVKYSFDRIMQTLNATHLDRDRFKELISKIEHNELKSVLQNVLTTAKIVYKNKLDDTYSKEIENINGIMNDILAKCKFKPYECCTKSSTIFVDFIFDLIKNRDLVELFMYVYGNYNIPSSLCKFENNQILTLLDCAINDNNQEIVQILRENNALSGIEYPFHVAVLNENIDACYYLFDNNINRHLINEQYETALDIVYEKLNKNRYPNNNLRNIKKLLENDNCFTTKHVIKSFEINKIQKCIAKLESIQPNYQININSQLQREHIKHLQYQRSSQQTMVNEFVKSVNRVTKHTNNIDIKYGYFVDREARRLHNALPIYSHRGKLFEVISDHQLILIIGHTGSGKSTQIGQYLIEDGFAKEKSMLCAQPRSLSAKCLAEYIQNEWNGNKNRNGYNLFKSYSNFNEEFQPKATLTFITYTVLLHELKRDRLLDKFSVIIIDEAHERTLIIDLVIGLLTDTLKERKDLKVIIMSATIDKQLFMKKLQITSDAVLEIKGKTYPVDVKHDDDDNFDETFEIDVNKIKDKMVKKILHINQNKPKNGDILAFVPDLRMINDVIESLNKFHLNNVSILPLHGKLEKTEIKKVFQDSYNDQIRKIVISTNIAETGITIDGIVYVIDSGICKSASYDPKRKMNVLKITSIPQSSAIQRQGRAGRTRPGICYRLYDEDTFNTMSPGTVPDILNCELTKIVLRLSWLSIKNIYKFNWLQSPSTASLNAAIQKLKIMGAVQDDRNNKYGLVLTKLGQQMMILDYDPCIAKLLLNSIELNVVIPCSIISSLLIFKNPIFAVPKNTNKTSANDTKQKRQDIWHIDGDYISWIKVLVQFVNLGSIQERRTWCKDRFIKYSVLKRVCGKMVEIIHQLNRVHNTIHLKDCNSFRDQITTIHSLIKSIDLENDGMRSKIVRCINNGFIMNLCFKRGRYWKLGYQTVISKQLCYNFPGNAYNVPIVRKSLNNYDFQYFVFGLLQKTSRPFILNLTPTDLNVLKADNPIFFQFYNVAEIRKNLQLDKIEFHSVSKFVMNKFRGRYNMNISQIEDELNVIIEIDKNKLIVWNPEKNLNQIKKQWITNKLQSIKKSIITEWIEHKRIGSTRAILNGGGQVLQILTDEDCISIFISNVSPHFSWNQETFTNYFQCKPDKVHKFGSNNRHSYGAITWLDASICEKILDRHKPNKQAQLSDDNFDEKCNWKIRKHNNRPSQSFASYNAHLYVTWPISKTTGFAYLYFSDSETAASLNINNEICQCEYEGVDELSRHKVKIRYKKLWRDNQSLYELIKANNESLIAVETIRAEATEEDIEKMNNSTFIIYKLFEDKQNQSVTSINVKRKDVDYMMAEIRCSDSGYVQYMKSKYDGNKNKNISVWGPLRIKITITASVSINKESYLQLKQNYHQIFQEIEQKYNVKLNFNEEQEAKHEDENTKMEIKLTHDDTEILRTAQSILRLKISAPERHRINVTKQEIEIIKEQAMFKQIEKNLNVYICWDKQREYFVNIYGFQNNRLGAIDKIINVVNQIHKHLKYEYINITLYVLQKIKKNNEFDIICKQCKADIELSCNGKITISGKENDVDNATKMINELLNKYSHKRKENEQKAQNITVCCVCFMGIELNEKYFELTVCGHQLHKECADHLSNTALKKESHKYRPLKCQVKDCDSNISLFDLRKLFTKKELKEFLNLCIDDYVDNKRNDKNELLYKHCPSPDCPQVYSTSRIGKWECDICHQEYCLGTPMENEPLRRTCIDSETKHPIPYHSNLSCKQYELQKVSDPISAAQRDEEFKKWLNERKENVKKCPKCGNNVEKNEGCNHMTCRCGAHWCWICGQPFDRSVIYQHIGTHR